MGCFQQVLIIHWLLCSTESDQRTLLHIQMHSIAFTPVMAIRGSKISFHNNTIHPERSDSRGIVFIIHSHVNFKVVCIQYKTTILHQICKVTYEHQKRQGIQMAFLWNLRSYAQRFRYDAFELHNLRTTRMIRTDPLENRTIDFLETFWERWVIFEGTCFGWQDIN